MSMMPQENLDAAVTDFSQAVGQLVRCLCTVSNTQSLSWTQTAVMTRLAKEGPATTADLARAEGMKPQSMGATVAALEELGIVERKPHPTDGRQVIIALTAEGAALRQSVKDARWTWLAHAIAELDESERETLFAAGAIIKRLVES